MTLETENVKNIYTADGVVVHWPYTFQIKESADVILMVVSASLVHTIISPTLYTVDTANSWVLYPKTGSPLPNDGTKVVVYRVTPDTQEEVFIDNGPFPAESVEDEYDRLAAAIQELREEVSRAIRYRIDQTPTDDQTIPILESTAEAAASAAAAAASAAAAAASAAAAAASAASFVNVPIGGCIDWPTNAMPTGNSWHLRDGAAISRTTYAALFALFNADGLLYGAGDGLTTFNLPNDTNRVTIAAGGTYALASVGGEATHVLTTAEMPVHSHGITDPGHSHGYSDGGHAHSLVVTGSLGCVAAQNGGPNQGVSGGGPGGGSWKQQTTANATIGISISSSSTGISGTNNSGSGSAHNNLQPYIAYKKIIRIL